MILMLIVDDDQEVSLVAVPNEQVGEILSAAATWGNVGDAYPLPEEAITNFSDAIQKISEGATSSDLNSDEGLRRRGYLVTFHADTPTQPAALSDNAERTET